MSGEIAISTIVISESYNYNYLIGIIILLIGFVFSITGVYFIAKWIAPGLEIDPNKAASVALVSSIVNMLLWFISLIVV